MVGCVRYNQHFAACGPAAAPLSAANPPTTRATHDSAAHGAGPGATEECTDSCECTLCC